MNISSDPRNGAAAAGAEYKSGGAEPSGLLPVQLPRDMDTVEAHCEDKPLDLEPYVVPREMPMILASV